MAFAAVQTATQVTGTGATVAVTLSATVRRNLVVVHIALSTAETCSGVSDDKGNTYVLSSAMDVGTRRVYQAYGVQVVGGTTTVTASFSGTAATKRVGADEYSGGKLSNATIIGNRTTGTGTGTDASVSTLTPTAAGNLIVALLTSTASVTWTAGTNFTLYGGSNPVTTRSMYRLAGGATDTAPATLSASNPWAEIATEFKIYAGPEKVKTVNSLAIASVKTVDGLEIASVKTINDLE